MESTRCTPPRTGRRRRDGTWVPCGSQFEVCQGGGDRVSARRWAAVAVSGGLGGSLMLAALPAGGALHAIVGRYTVHTDWVDGYPGTDVVAVYHGQVTPNGFDNAAHPGTMTSTHGGSGTWYAVSVRSTDRAAIQCRASSPGTPSRESCSGLGVAHRAAVARRCLSSRARPGCPIAPGSVAFFLVGATLAAL